MQERDRHSQRRPGHDYATAGWYHVTICTAQRYCLFGTIDQGQMVLNDAGRMLWQVWNDIPRHYPGVALDAMQVMPNHLHGVLAIQPVGAAPCGRPSAGSEDGRARGPAPTGRLSAGSEDGRARGPAPTGRPSAGSEDGRARGPAPTGRLSIPDLVQRFKSLTTNRYIDGVRLAGWAPFSHRLWQRNYHDRVIRNDRELLRIRQYIRANPANWERDRNHPS